MTKRLLVLLGCLTFPVSLFPFPGLSAQKRAMSIDAYLALKSVGDPQLSPDGKWVAYTVTEHSLKDNRGITRIWLADVASGSARQLTAGPGSDRQPRWSADGRALRGPRRPDDRDRRRWGRERFARWERDRGRRAWRFDRRRQYERGRLHHGAGRLRDACADRGTRRRQHAALFARRQVARAPLDGAGRVRGGPTATDAGRTGGRADGGTGRRGNQGLDALRRVLHLVPRFEMPLRRGRGARARQRVPDRAAVVPSFRRGWRWWRQHGRAGDAGRSGALVPAPEQYPTQRDLALRPPAHASQRCSPRDARSPPARRARLRGRARRLRLRVAAQAARLRPRQAVSPYLSDSRRAAGRLDRLLERALELRDVRVARIRGGRGQFPRLDRLRPEVHGRHFPALGGLSVPGSHEGPRRRGTSPLRRFDAHGRGGCVLRRLHDLLDPRAHRPLQDAGIARRRVQSGQHGGEHGGAVVHGLGIRRHAVREP